MDKKTQQKQKSGNAFYIVLSLCLIAVGVAAWSAVSAFNDFKTQENIDSVPQEQQFFTPESEAPVTSELPKVEYDITENHTKENTETKTEVITKPIATYFLFPIEQGQVIKNFDATALQYSNTFGDMRLHLGLDIKAEKGSAVKSAGKGTVTEIYNDTSFGNTVVIDHGNGIIAKYCGLSEEVAVSVGSIVEAGTEIGTIGTVICESADENHLHFEMFKDGVSVSPLETMAME